MLMFTYLIGQRSLSSNYIPQRAFVMTNPFLSQFPLKCDDAKVRWVTMEGHTPI